MKRTRRQVLKLLAAGSAAALVAPATALAEERKPAVRAGTRISRTTPATIRAEVEKQKKDFAGLLKTLRDYRLTPGSEQGFAFRPLRAKRQGAR